MNVSAYKNTMLKEIADIRKPVEFKTSKPIPIPIQDYKYQSLNIKDAVNPPSIQTYYPFPDLKIQPESRLSHYPKYQDRDYNSFSFNA